MSSDEVIPFAGTVRFEQYRRAQLLHLKDSVTRWSVIVTVAAIGAFLLVVNLASDQPSWSSAGFLVPPAVLLLWRALQERSYRQTWRSHQLAREPVRGQLSDHGLAVEGEHGSARIPWDRLYRWRAADDLLLIYEGSNAMHLLPRAFFAGEEDWQAARALVAAKLSTTESRSRWSSVKQLLLWVAILIVLVLLYAALAGKG